MSIDDNAFKLVESHKQRVFFPLSIKVSFELEICESLTSIACFGTYTQTQSRFVCFVLVCLWWNRKTIWRDLSVVIRANEERVLVGKTPTDLNFYTYIYFMHQHHTQQSHSNRTSSSNATYIALNAKQMLCSKCGLFFQRMCDCCTRKNSFIEIIF